MKKAITALFLVTVLNINAQHSISKDANSLLIFEESFESGQMNLKKSGNAPEVVKFKNARAGKYVMKSQIDPSKEVKYRTEVSLNEEGLIFEVGKEYWIGISTMLSDDFNTTDTIEDQGMLFQWHYFDWRHPKALGQPQPLLVRYQDGNVHVMSELLDEKMASLAPTFGEWDDWVIHYKLDNKDGIIQVWRNKELIVDWTGDNHQLEKHDGAYLKLGLYSAQFKSKGKPWSVAMPADYSRTVYHDEIRIAGENGSYEMVAPKSKQ